MSKKLISLSLIFTLIISLCSFGASATPDTRHDALKAFGIADGTEPDGSSLITRSQFICMAVRMSGINAELYSTYPEGFPFSDVHASDAEFPYVRAAYEMGVINGTGSGIFDGKSNVDIQQTTKILISLLGHGEKAEVLGGYPYGYISVANDIDLYDGIDMSGASLLDAKTAYELIMNALESTFVAITSISEYTKYEKTDKMYMSQMLGIYKTEGIVEQNEHTSLYGESEVTENEIEINGIVFKAGSTNASSMLGYYVNCYFKENGSANEIIHIEANSEENRVLHLTSRDLNPESSTLSELSYTDSGIERKAKMSPEPILIRNESMTTLTLNNLWPENGEIILISNNGDNSYDVAKVYDYRTVVVNNVSATPGSISDALGGKSIILDASDNDYTFSIELSGNDTPLRSLLKNDVAFYYETSGETPHKKLIVSRKIVEGKIEGKTDDKLIIDGTEYYARKEFLNEVSPGDMGTFFLDPHGAVAYGELTDEISVYGYLTGIKKSGMNGVQMKIFTEKDRWVELDVRSKIKLNGKAATEDDLYAFFTSAPDFRQLISYRVDSNAEVTSVTIAVDCSADSVIADTALENDDFRLSQKVENTVYRRYLSSFTNYFTVSPDTIIFFVPEDGENEDDFYISSASNLRQNYTYQKVYAYNANETRVTDLIVIFTKTSSVDNSDNVSEFLIVDKMSRSIIDGEELSCIYGTYGSHGKTCVYLMNDEIISAAGGIEKGDVLQLGFNNKGLVSAVSKLYDISNGTYQKDLINGSLYSNATIASGIVTSVDTGHMRFTLDYGDDTDALFGLDSYLKIITVYDISDEEVYQIAPTDIEKGDRIVVGCRQYQAQSLIIFRD